MKFSICIPNYNYAHYIGRTIGSVLVQQAEFEIIVADNASTDDSVAVIEAYDDPRIRLVRNRRNVGFAGNLDRATAPATGERMILLSSDDLAAPDALASYARLADALGERADRAIFASDVAIIDGEDRHTGRQGMNRRLWAGAAIDTGLSEAVGATVWRIEAGRLLANSLRDMRVPFAFAATCYPAGLYREVEGYGGGRMYNPDKDFAWKLLAVADEAFHVEAPLFEYRVHATNQQAQQARAGALKHLTDQYIASFDTAPDVLARGESDREAMARSFVEQDIVLRGLQMVAEGKRRDARRGVLFGRAAYPHIMRASAKGWMLRGLLALGPVGTRIARPALRRALKNYRRDDG